LCLLHWSSESDTHSINVHIFFKESRNIQVALHVSYYCESDAHNTYNFVITYSTTANVWMVSNLLWEINADINWSILASQSALRNNEGHMESVQPIKCMRFILICNNTKVQCTCLQSLIGNVTSIYVPFHWFVCQYNALLLYLNVFF